MLRAFKTPRSNDHTVFYFGESDAPKTKESNASLFLGVGAVALVFAATLLIAGGESDDGEVLGTNRRGEKTKLSGALVSEKTGVLVKRLTMFANIEDGVG